jgi:hypothetical protein
MTAVLARAGVGRKKKLDSIKRTYRMSGMVLRMLELYAVDRSLDLTASVNTALFDYLSTLGYRARVDQVLKLEELAEKPAEKPSVEE